MIFLKINTKLRDLRKRDNFEMIIVKLADTITISLVAVQK